MPELLVLCRFVFSLDNVGWLGMKGNNDLPNDGRPQDDRETRKGKTQPSGIGGGT